MTIKVVFLGNHTVGVRTLQTLIPRCSVVGVIAHPLHPEEGRVYESVFECARASGIDVLRGAPNNSKIDSFLRNLSPDLLWVTDYRYLLPPRIIASSRLGAVNLHPSMLPKYRGRAPINWAILHGEKTLGLTGHFIDEGMDTGDIICQRSFELSDHEDVGDALNRLYPIYIEMTRELIGHFTSGHVPRQPQNHSLSSTFPARQAQDGLIDWSEPAEQVRNLVRAVARPYPGAFTYLRGMRVNVWRSTLHETRIHAEDAPGTVLTIEDGRPIVRCGMGALRLDEWDGAGELQLKPGAILGG